MKSQDDLIIEQAKQLALTISLFNNKYDTLIGEFNKKITDVYLRLNEKQSKYQDKLNENLIYQETLTDAKSKLDSYINTIQNKFVQYSLYNESVPNIIIQDSKESDNNLSQYIDNNEILLKYLCNTVQTNYEFLLNSIKDSNKNLDELSTKLAIGIDDVEYKLDNFKSKTKKDINNIIEIVDNIKDKLVNDLAKSFDDISIKIDNEVDRLDKNISILKNDIHNQSKIITSIEDSFNSHLTTLSSSIEGLSQQFDTYTNEIEVSFNDVDDKHNTLYSVVDEIQNKQESLTDSIDDIFNTLKNKPEYQDILLKSDLDKLKEDIISAIPMPKDGTNGKDAEDWEFKPHPSRKGILIFKKKSQKNWNYIDLNHIVPKIQEYEQSQGFGYVGGGGSGSSISILWNNTVVSLDSHINFTGTAITSVTSQNNITTVRIDGGVGTGGGSGLALVKYQYNKPLSGFSVLVPKTEHNINEIVSYNVRKNSDGKTITISNRIFNGDVYIDSNIDMTNTTLYLVGFNTIRKYIKALSGISTTVLSSEHNIVEILNYDVRNATGKLIEVADSLNIVNNTIIITSNIDLTNCVLTIKGI